jgi:hypothetical protein
MPVKALLSLIVVAMLAGAAWLGRDSAPLQRWWPATLAAPGAGAAADAQGPRKCVGPERVLYTDGACPAGTKAQGLDGGSLTVLPAAPAQGKAPLPVAGPAAAASVQTPLRRLAGEGGLPDQAERRVDQALHR